MSIPTPEDVDQAAGVLGQFLKPTPLVHSTALSQQAGAEVLLKLETMQPVRAFKVRGALNKISRIKPEQRHAGVITASAGNHGMGVAFAASRFDVPATVFMPQNANASKVVAVQRLGAQVIQVGDSYSAANAAAKQEQEARGATFVHAYEDAEVIAGQGTIARELLGDLDSLDTVFVGIGGGGLIGGIAMYLKERRPGVKVIGVEPAGADAMARSLRKGAIVTLDSVSTIADGLAASAPGPLTFELATRYLDDVVVIDEDEMLNAIRLLFDSERLLAEPAGAAALAALMYRRPSGRGQRTVVIVSGANVEREVLLRALR